MGRPGTLNEADNVVKKAAEMIRQGDVEQDKITKSVLVIDEAQDMSEDDFALVEALMQRNETMRVIAVGDDDQNIYAFRGSDSKFMRNFSPNMTPCNTSSQRTLEALARLWTFPMPMLLASPHE